MTISSSSVFEPQRIRGIEMPWNRVLRAAADTAASAAQALGPWHPQEFLAECVETELEAGDMMTFVFRRLDGAPLAFRAGQYLNIAFPVEGTDGEPIDRSYSLSSSPTQPWTFSITVKRDGLVSQWAHENVKPGTVLDMLGPVGAFHLPDFDRRARYLFLAAGSGITPLMSMLRTIHSLPGKANVVMLYHAAEPGGFAFSRELEYLRSVDSRIRVYYSLGDRGAAGPWEGMVGRLTADMIEQVTPDVAGREIYACGPEGYLDAAAELLRSLNVSDTQIHQEFFTGDRQTVAEYEEEVAMAEELAGEVAASGEEYYAQQPTALDLYAQRDANAESPPTAGFGEDHVTPATEELQAAPAGPPSAGFGAAPAGPPSSGFGEAAIAGPPSSGFGEAPSGPPTSGFPAQQSGPPSSGFNERQAGPPGSGFDAQSDEKDAAVATPVASVQSDAEQSDEGAKRQFVAPTESAYDTYSFKTVGEGTYKISFMRSQLNVMVTPDEPILQAARRAGVRIGMNCQEGMCGSCKSVKLEGEVDMNHQGGIRAREIEAGKFLPCCATAQSDVVVDA